MKYWNGRLKTVTKVSFQMNKIDLIIFIICAVIIYFLLRKKERKLELEKYLFDETNQDTRKQIRKTNQDTRNSKVLKFSGE